MHLKTYKNYKKQGTLEEIKASLHEEPSSKEREYLKKSLNPCINILQLRGHHQCINFTGLLQQMKLRAKDIRDLILDCQEYLKSEKNINTSSINRRAVQKSNNSEKNVFLNRLILEYKDEVFQFLQNYKKLQNNPYFDIKKIEELIGPEVISDNIICPNSNDAPVISHYFESYDTSFTSDPNDECFDPTDECLDSIGINYYLS